jgi:putative glycerol-1-phosphate prenyltransferase
MSVFSVMLKKNKTQKASYCVLIDPDKLQKNEMPGVVENAVEAGVDALLIGGSLLLTPDFDGYLKSVKKYSKNCPVIIFPGGINQISGHADALLYLSLLSGRNAHHLIGSQVMAAPIINRLGIETISTAYMLVESGRTTSAQFMSGTTPLPRHKPEIAVAHALAAQYLGFKLIYFEGGSGAERSVPEEMIAAVAHSVDIPLMVGGGIRTPEEAVKKISAGASFIVTGTVLESQKDFSLIKEFCAAIHGA